MRASLVSVLAVMALLALAVPVVAQESTADTCITYPALLRVRVAQGDIPCTTPVESSSTWNIAQTLEFQHAFGTPQTFTLFVPNGHSVTSSTCTCAGLTTTPATGTVTFNVPANATAGKHTLTLGTATNAGSAFGFTLVAPADLAEADQLVTVHLAAGSNVLSPAHRTETSPLAGVNDARMVWSFTGKAGQPAATWYTVQPATLTAPPAANAGGINWMSVGIGVFCGIVVWGVLVQMGMVQKKSRKQVAAVAAHVEAAQKEPKPVLEARKRALMAALKEVELARQANEIDVPTYDTVKADLKKQTVTVMRAIEEAA